MDQHEPLTWTAEASARLERVPEGMMRDMTRRRVERLARHRGSPAVTLDLMDDKYRQWDHGSQRAESELTWTAEALTGVERIPTFVRGMVVKAIETYARGRGLTEVSLGTVEEAKGHWGETGKFHQP